VEEVEAPLGCRKPAASPEVDDRDGLLTSAAEAGDMQSLMLLVLLLLECAGLGCPAEGECRPSLSR
jgi:hypothetical protein